MDELLKVFFIVIAIVGPLIAAIWAQFNSRFKRIESESEKNITRLEKRSDKLEENQRVHNERMYATLEEIKKGVNQINVELAKTYVCRHDCDGRHAA